MVKWLKVGALAVVALLVAASASGDSNTYNYQGTGPYFNPKSGQKVDATGNAYMTEADKDRDNWAYYSLINNQFGATLADSNATPVDTHGYSRMALVFYPQFDSLSTELRFAVQVRAHYGSSTDSAATFPWYRWSPPSATITARVDSIGHYQAGSYVAAQSTAANSANGGLWSGEFEVKFSVNRQDTTGAGLGKFGGYPKGVYVQLNDGSGAPFWAPYTSVRVRVLNGIKTRARLRVDLVAAGK